MRSYIVRLCLACLGSSLLPLSAQQPFATIKKNLNVQAKGLVHELNTSKDTLVLASDSKINYVYSINDNVKRELSYTVNAKSFEVPLQSLSTGRHVFVVVQSPLRIVFVINILGKGLAVVSQEEDLELVASKND